MKEKILNTEAFKELDSVTQLIYGKQSKIQEIEREYNVAKTIGIQKYNYIYTPGPYKLKVITELINNDNDNTQ